jgi:hypothetical protein
MEIITREAAIANSLSRYYTGQPCKYGHVVERLVSDRACLTCARKTRLAWAANNKPRMARNRRARRVRNPERHREYDRNRYQLDPRMKMLSAAKQRAEDRGLDFSIGPTDIRIPTHCPLLGIKIEIGGGTITDNSPTIDRIKNSTGYVQGNVVVVSHVANRCKGSLASADLFRIAVNLHDLENDIAPPEWLAVEKGIV